MKTIELFQWDLNKQIPCSFPEAHFACVGSEDALIVKANGGNVSIPNVLLQEGKDIMVWMMEDGAVADSGRIRIVTRAKPADYIYTETEVITFESLVAKVEDVIAKGNAATDSAATAAQKADAAANKANAASDKAAQVEAEIKASEARRVEAEQGRAEAEATRAAHESKRTESFNTSLVSWNSKVDAACKKATDTASKAAQDVKTATDAAIAKTEEATQAAVAKAQTATDNATTAANKAEAAVAKLPLPLGNTLKGEVESTMVSVHDAYPAPLVTTKVMGQSNQQQEPAPSPENPQEITNLNKAELVITGKNLINPNRLAQIDSSYYQAVDGQLKVINSHNAAWKDVPIYGTLQAGTYTLSGDNIEIRDTALNQIVNIMSTQVKQFTLNNPTAIKMKIGYGWPKYPVITKAQLEVGSKATAYEPHKSKNTVIDLKGNELCSLPNGVKDEVVIDAEGNVSLIKRTKQYSWNCVQIINGTGRNYAVDKVLDIGANYTGLVAEKAINAVNNTIGICYVNQKMIYVTVPESVTTKEQANQLYGGMKVIYQLAEPQTIPLGKVELPALPEATSNVWNDGNIPANVYINYLKDVNIAYTDLENQIKQITAALSVMDTPTVIPEMAWGTPAAI